MISQYQFTDSARRRRSTTTFTSKMWKSTIIIRKQTGKITPECRVNHKQITVAWGIAHRDRKQTACWCGICARSPPASGIGCRCLRSRCRRTWDSDRSNGRSTTAADSPRSRRTPQQVRTRLHRYIKSQTRMALSRAHTSARQADTAKLLLLNAEQTCPVLRDMTRPHNPNVT